jgi:SAM-dependent methyltransferase
VAEWWSSFFVEGWAEVVGDAIDPARTTAEIDRIEQLLELEPGARVLDVPCGAGRLTIPLAERGFRMVGVDITAEYLERGRRQASEAGVEIEWVDGDMRKLPWRGELDGAFCFGGSFGYFDDAGNAAFLAAVARALRPGARFLVDTHLAETVFPKFQQRGWNRIGEVLMLEERGWDKAAGRVESEWTFVREGNVIAKNRSSIRVYTARELRALLEDAGFTEVEALDAPMGEELEIGSVQAILSARLAP